LPAELSTTLDKVRGVENRQNRALLEEYCQFLRNIGASDRHQSNTLKAAFVFSAFLSTEVVLSEISRKERILAFLDTKVKAQEIDPDRKWITTWNDYVLRINHFYR